MSDSLNPKICFDSEGILAIDHFQTNHAFDLLGNGLKERLTAYLNELGCDQDPVVKGEVHPQAVLEGPVYVSAGAKIGPGAYIVGPCFIGKDAEVRHSAFIRGFVYAGASSVIGHTTEVKGSVFGRNAKAGHFAYVGDSLIGDNCNLGAGTKLANLKMDKSLVKYCDPDTGKRVGSGLKKFGAVLANGSQTGCNAVLSPGSILMAETAVMPCHHFLGTLMSGVAGSKSETIR
ncbi:MAG: hypothetical protein HRU19_06465 [Pseudobacteriovorax sp.]|nr:hypothetical protein [Pseudobacteriovorax sp.]